MKVGRLKRRADAAEVDAAEKWLEFKNHSGRSFTIVKRRVGSPAGLAIFFSLGFVAGGRSVQHRDRVRGSQRQDEGEVTDRGLIHKVTHGPIGETAVKLATAFLARSLLDSMEQAQEGAHASSAAHAQGPDVPPS